MNRVITVLIIFSVILLGGCQIIPEPDYLENDDVANNTTAGAFEITQVGGFYLGGSISSETDVDYWKINIPSGSVKLYLETYYNKELISNILNISIFPIHFTEYDQSAGSEEHLYVGAVPESNLTLTNPDYIILKICGSDDYRDGAYQVYFYAGDQ